MYRQGHQAASFLRNSLKESAASFHAALGEAQMPLSGRPWNPQRMNQQGLPMPRFNS
jgi:hypothetical protein